MAFGSRNYCFTINNYTQDIIDNLNKYYNEGCCNFLVYGLEIGEKGTPHVQGYVEFANQKTMSAFNKNIGCKKGGNWADCRQRLGTPKEAAGYCKKGSLPSRRGQDIGNEHYFDNPSNDWDGKQFGFIASQGSRTDLKEITDKIMSGELKVNQIKIDNPMLYHQYGRTLNEVEDLYLRKQFRTEMTQGVWLFGPTGVGKSHLAFMDFDPETTYEWKKNDKGWQDGYNGQETVIINEFRGGDMTYDQLLELVDKWPCTVSRRGREPVPFLAKTVIITSSLAPEDIFKNRNKKDSIAQLHERFVVKRLEGQSKRPKTPAHNPTVSKLLKSGLGVIIHPSPVPKKKSEDFLNKGILDSESDCESDCEVENESNCFSGSLSGDPIQ